MSDVNSMTRLTRHTNIYRTEWDMIRTHALHVVHMCDSMALLSLDDIDAFHVCMWMHTCVPLVAP